MPMLADLVDAVIGVDTHTDTHTAAVWTGSARTWPRSRSVRMPLATPS